jgi:TolB protein
VIQLDRPMVRKSSSKVIYGIHVMNIDGSGLMPLTDGGSFPDWSPDGRWIVFTSNNSEIYVMNANGSDQMRLTSHPAGATDKRPAWSSDGQQIVFASDRDRIGAFNIYLMNTDDSGLRRLAEGYYPDWSR